MADEFPTPRRSSAMFMYRRQLILWGGFTQVFIGEGEEQFMYDSDLPGPDDDDAYLEIFDLDTCEWHKQLTFGPFPRLGHSSCYGVIGNMLYVTGGMNDEAYFDGTCALDLETFKWTSLTNAPLPRALGGCVVHGTALFTFGGIGNRPMRESRCGAKCDPDDSFQNAFGTVWNNALHMYETKTGTWKEIVCNGVRPPPCEKFTFNRIDRNRVILIGGKRRKFDAGFNTIYFFDLNTFNWKGPYGPSSTDEKWPDGRGLHSAACLVDPESDLAESGQHLIVFWGDGLEAKILNDVWILSVSMCNLSWTQLHLDTSFRPRKCHMSCSYHITDRQADVFVFGGNKQRKTKFEKNVMTDLLIFRFGSVRSLEELCLHYLKKNNDSYANHTSLLSPNILNKLENLSNSSDFSVVYPYEKNTL